MKGTGRILITGAAGFIGSHVTDQLLAEGRSVVGVDNLDPFYPAALKRRNLAAASASPDFRLVEADIRDADAMDRVFAEGRFSGDLTSASGTRSDDRARIAALSSTIT